MDHRFRKQTGVLFLVRYCIDIIAELCDFQLLLEERNRTIFKPNISYRSNIKFDNRNHLFVVLQTQF